MKIARLTDARFHQALRKLTAQTLPLRAAFKLKGIAATLDAELKKFEECRQAALEKFGKRGEDGNIVTREDGSVEFDNEQLKAFAAELNDLGQEDINLESVKMEELGNKVELTADELFLLDGVIVE